MGEIEGWDLADRFEVRDIQALPTAKAVWRIPSSAAEQPQCVCVFPADELTMLREALQEAGL